MIDLEIPPFLRQIFILAIIIVSIIGLKFSAPIVGPVLLSVFFSILIYPFLIWLKNKGMSYNLALTITIMGALALGIITLIFLFYTLNQLISQLPSLSIDSASLLAEPANELIRTIISTIDLSNIGNIVANGFFVLFATIFLIYELPALKYRLTEGLGADNPFLNHLLNLTSLFIKYFIIRIKVNLFMAIGATIFLIILDINFALLWGILTFALGFIPYLGLILATIPPMLIAWSQYGIQGALGVIILFVIINTIAENYILPRQAGKELQLSIYVVFISLFIWGWILGSVGILLAIPLTIIAVKYLESFDETHWVALLMKREDSKLKKRK